MTPRAAGRAMGPLVGAFAKRGAEAVLAALHAGTPLELEREPDNPYDEFALRVNVRARELLIAPITGELNETLEGFGMDLGELVTANDIIWLGYIGASGGKPLAKLRQDNPALVGNQEFIQLLDQDEGLPMRSILTFGGGGEPMVVLEVAEPEAE